MNTILILWVMSLFVNGLFTFFLPEWDAWQRRSRERDKTRQRSSVAGTARSTAKAA